MAPPLAEAELLVNVEVIKLKVMGELPAVSDSHKIAPPLAPAEFVVKVLSEPLKRPDEKIAPPSTVAEFRLKEEVETAATAWAE